MSVLEISSKSTLLELLEISVERRGLLKATLSEPHPAPGHVGARGPRGPSFPPSLDLWKVPSVVRTTTFFTSSWGVEENI